MQERKDSTVETPSAATAITPYEVELLAEKMAKSYARRLAYYREHYDVEEAEEKAKGTQRGVEQALPERHPHDVTWHDLSICHNRQGHDGYRRLWSRIKRHAHDTLEAGASISTYDQEEGPWMQAARLAARERFVEDWQPRGAVETALLDVLAQTFVKWQFWQSLEMKWGGLKDGHEWGEGQEPHSGPRLSYADAAKYAAEMAERSHRQFMRTIRGLRDLRRFAGNITIQNSGQVNIAAQQQVNGK